VSINIVFDGPPSHESCRFVEVENDFGESIKCGEWIENDDGTWTLKIDEIPPQAIVHVHDGRGEDSDTCQQCGLNFRAKVHKRNPFKAAIANAQPKGDDQ